MSAARLVLGTRGSALARAQAEAVRRDLERLGAAVETRIIRTKGDADAAPPLWAIGGQGIFTKELEEALRRGEIDLAVHSLKDMPTRLPDDMEIAAVPRRADPRDALVTREGLDLASLPQGTSVGTSSLRRMAQLVCERPDLSPRNLRGNVDTRLGRVLSGELPAALLACAGLARLGALPAGLKAVPLPLDRFVPAAAQGALAIECLKGRAPPQAARLNDPASEAATRVERELLARMGVGCHVPLGAHASGGALSAFLSYPDGRSPIRVSESGPPESLAALVADRMERAGARPILDFVNAAVEKAMAKGRP